MSSTSVPPPSAGAFSELWAGFRTFWRGFAFWQHAPGMMSLGLLPAALAALILVAGLVLLAMFLDPLVGVITPFADGWDATWRSVLRITVGLAVLITAGVLSARIFSALALTLGGPIYERICRFADTTYGRGTADATISFWRSLGDMGGIVARSIGGSLLVGLISLIPVVGSPLGITLGVLLTAFIITREFTLLPFQLRGLDASTRNAVLRASRWRRLGFGLGVQLCYAVPLGAVITMPCAVAAGTRLARELLGEPVLLGEPDQALSNRPVSD
ncbi:MULTISPECIES: EI24 domain-containing protein [unclassified Salinibacterium]|uniref:EI24 domain-containing protein n=1 Tax=unclassified Salinibacterium TaxID=2632331 RepID=UPI00141FC24E|nr:MULTISPECIES: EI24 domain-containing protein [unclassified Salinibacterium]